MKLGNFELNLTSEELKETVSSKMRDIELITPEDKTYAALPEGDKKALVHLIKAAKIINDVALKQDHELNLTLKKLLEDNLALGEDVRNAYKLFLSLNGVAGLNGVDKEPIEIFKGVHQSKGKNFYPADLSVEEFHDILIKMFENNKIEEIKRVLSGRTMVRRKGGELEGIDYTVSFAKEFSEIANELEVAAHYATEHEFKDYLGWQAQALLQNNEDMDMLADKHWAVLQHNRLEFTISRENYEDELTGTVFENTRLKDLIEQHQIEVNPKDTLGCRVGLNNLEGTDFILKSKETIPYLAARMPLCEQYVQKIEQGNKQTMVDADLMMLTGDYAMCRGGITTAQNLPNDDKLSVKTGGGRRNVYHRQVRFSDDAARTKKMLDALVAPQFHQYYQKNMMHPFVIGHENGHSLGPDSSYKNALGVYAHTIEEHKANIISACFLEEIARTFGTYTDFEVKQIYTTWIVSLFLKAEPVLSEPHRVADLMEFNYLLEHQAIWFDSENKLHIAFEKIAPVIHQCLHQTIEVQLSKSPETAKNFIEKWCKWSDISAYIASVQQKLGLKPYIHLITNF